MNSSIHTLTATCWDKYVGQLLFRELTHLSGQMRDWHAIYLILPKRVKLSCELCRQVSRYQSLFGEADLGTTGTW